MIPSVMTQVPQAAQAETAVDWLTTMAIAAVAIGLTQVIHEGLHALTCTAVGAKLQEFSALHVSCQSETALQSKLVSGSASIINLIAGMISLALLRRSRHRAPELVLFLWLFMLMSWLLGTGYWLFSGVANIGDWANVIAGWEPHWLWRFVMAGAGTASYMFLVWLALHELGKIIGGDEAREQIRRAVKLGLLAYLTVFLVILLAGLFNPYGITGLPAVAAMLLALGGMFPLVWMMQWFRAKSFVKSPGAPLQIRRRWSWIVTAAIVISVYVVVLGPGWEL